MNSEDRIRQEDQRVNWREEARSRAAKEADERGLNAVPNVPHALSEREKFIAKRELEIYAELEKIGNEL